VTRDLSECRVLVVDDVKTHVDVLVSALRGRYRLSVALDGDSALRSIAACPPDLVLLDVVMPGLDGYEVCRRLRARPATREVPVMFLSSLEDARDKVQGFEAGGNDYLTKPFDRLEVQARVKSLLRAKADADAVKEAAAREMRIAREIQTGILPPDVGEATAGTGLEVAAVLEPALEVSGDLYDVLRASEDRLVLSLGDVAGKGVPAALLMAVVSTQIRATALHHDRPDEILECLNAHLVRRSPRGMFVTISCATYDVRTRRLVCANAAHPPAMLRRRGEAPRTVLGATATMVGVLPSLAIGTNELVLEPGDTLVLYSDGVTEARDARGRMFGQDGLLAHLAKEPEGDAAATAARILDAVRRHAGDAPQSDDITLLVLRAQ
jgi:sigma-B regulation protein RsbU (phosphoserine phosphatase)